MGFSNQGRWEKGGKEAFHFARMREAYPLGERAGSWDESVAQEIYRPICPRLERGPGIRQNNATMDRIWMRLIDFMSGLSTAQVG